MLMNWQVPIDFGACNYDNNPFAIHVPALIVTRAKSDRLNILTVMRFTRRRRRALAPARPA